MESYGGVETVLFICFTVYYVMRRRIRTLESERDKSYSKKRREKHEMTIFVTQTIASSDQSSFRMGEEKQARGGEIKPLRRKPATKFTALSHSQSIFDTFVRKCMINGSIHRAAEVNREEKHTQTRLHFTSGCQSFRADRVGLKSNANSQQLITQICSRFKSFNY